MSIEFRPVQVLWKLLFADCVNKVGEKDQTARTKIQQPAESEDRRDVPLTRMFTHLRKTEDVLLLYKLSVIPSVRAGFEFVYMQDF